MDFISMSTVDNISVTVILSVVAISIITDKLVWHTRLRRAEARADRWERIALEALSTGAKAGVRAAEVTADVVAAIPDPELDRQERM